MIQKLPELCLPFGCKRAPAYQFIARLRNYEPDLKDVLILSSTASTDVGLITRSSKPLSSDEDAKKTTDVFTTTEVSDDTKRASLPLTDSSEDTSVIGLGVDLSSTQVVIAPITGEDIAESSTPLPNLFLLNNEGILASWWFIYSEAVRKQLPYHGQVTGNKAQPQSQPQPQPMQSEAPKQPAFGQSAFGQPAFGQSAFGSPSGSAFGKPSGTPSFGTPSAMGGRSQPSFGAPSLPGAPSFGSPSQPGSSFGAPSALGQRGPAQFGKSSFGSSTASPFGQSSTPGNGGSSLPFASSGAPAGGGFGSFANSGSGGFSGFAAAKPAGESPFSKPAGESPFAKASTESPFAKASTESPFGKPATENPFGKPSGASPFGGLASNTSTGFSSQKTEDTKGTFGLGSSGFVLGSTMKGDGSAVNDGPKPDKPSGGLFSLGASMDDMVSSPNKPSTPAESMDDAEDAPAAPSEQDEKPEAKQPAPSLFGGSSFGSQSQTSQPFGAPQTNKSPFSLFGNTEKKSSPLSPQSEQTVTPSKPKDEPDAKSSPATSMAEPPLPPDPTSKAVYGPGDTSASSNVSKSSVEDAPLPPDFTIPPKSKPTPSPSGGEPPLPPDFTQKPKESEKAEEAPLPPDPATSKPAATPTKEEPGPVPDGSEADESEKEGESDFEDSGEEITHEDEEDEEEEKGTPEKKTVESSFDSQFSTTSSTEGLFSRLSKPDQKKQQPQQQQPPRSLFGATTQPLLPPAPRAHHESPRSPSPVRNGRKSTSEQPPGSTLAARKAELARHAVEEKLKQQEKEEKERKARERRMQQEQEEAAALAEDDEEEKLRADLAAALEPVPTLDPFLPHQDYAGQPSRPGIPGQIERLYHDINSMVDTLGINARSLSCFLLYQRTSVDSDWIEKLQGEYPSESLDQKVRLSEIEKFDDAVLKLSSLLEKQRLQGVDQKLEACHALLSKDIITLRGQCASIQKTLDAHTDAAAIVSAPLSAEQLTLQQDLRKASTDIQARLADLESAVSLLRARIADAPRDGASRSTKRPTVEAVTSTISTMMNMAESKRSDIDVLEAQLKKLGIDTATTPGSREGSPFATPRKGKTALPTTPGSTTSRDGPVSSYHTPESAGRAINFRSSVNGSARASRLRNVNGANDLVSKTETVQWKMKSRRRQHLVGSLKKAIDEKKVKVRSADDM